MHFPKFAQLTLAVICLVAAAQAGPWKGFREDQFLPQGGDLAMADFNGDSIPDVASILSEADKVEVMLGTGSGLSAAVEYATGQTPSQLLAGDFNGDGKIDLISLNQLNGSGLFSLSVLFGNGDGTFQPHLDTPLAGYGESFVTTDFDRDGKSDLAVVTDSSCFCVTVYLSNGDGTFSSTQTVDTVNASAGDVNNDGNPDLVITAHEGIQIYLGQGDGTFQTDNVVYEASVAHMTLGDLNGDGNLDIAGPSLEKIQILLGNGDGTFQPRVPYDTVYFPSDIELADLDGDGNLDLVTSGLCNCLAVHYGRGDGTLEPWVGYGTTGGGGSIAIGDMNGDVAADIVTGGNGIDILLNRGTRDFVARRNFGVGTKSTSVATGDFNGDGKLDIVTGNDVAPTLTVLLGNGDGTFQPFVATLGTEDPFALAIGDFNNDGKLDVAGAADPYFQIALGQGDGTFHAVPPVRLSNIDAIAAADFNADHRLDLVLVAGSKPVIFLGDGHGNFDQGTSFAPNSTPTSVAVADLNGDGKPDVVLGQTDGFTVMLGNGDGTLQAPVAYGSGNHKYVAIADFNHDGHLDVVGSLSTASRFDLLLGNGDGTFQEQISVAGGTAGTFIAVADFNRDGNSDVIMGSSVVSVMLGRGDGTFEEPKAYVNFGVDGMAVGDFNNDKFPDVANVYRLTRPSLVSVLLNRGNFQ